MSQCISLLMIFGVVWCFSAIILYFSSDAAPSPPSTALLSLAALCLVTPFARAVWTAEAIAILSSLFLSPPAALQPAASSQAIALVRDALASRLRVISSTLLPLLSPPPTTTTSTISSSGGGGGGVVGAAVPSWTLFVCVFALHVLLRVYYAARAPRHSHPVHAQDVARAATWVREKGSHFGLRSDGVVLAGHSAGGHLAALVGSDDQYLKSHGLGLDYVKGVISMSGVYKISALDRWPFRSIYLYPAFGRSRAGWDLASPMTYVNRDNLPHFLLMVARNETTDFSDQAIAYMNALNAADPATASSVGDHRRSSAKEGVDDELRRRTSSTYKTALDFASPIVPRAQLYVSCSTNHLTFPCLVGTCGGGFNDEIVRAVCSFLESCANAEKS